MGEDGQSILEQLQESFADFMWSMGSRFATDESGKLWRARSRLYRSQLLQGDMRLKALAEINRLETLISTLVVISPSPTIVNRFCRFLNCRFVVF